MKPTRLFSHFCYVKRGTSSGEFFFSETPFPSITCAGYTCYITKFYALFCLFFMKDKEDWGPFVFRLTRGSSYVGKQGTAGEISISSPLTSLQLCLSLFLSLMLGWPQNAISFSCHEGNVTTSVFLSARREKKQIKSDLHAAKQMYQQVSFLSGMQHSKRKFLCLPHTFF